MADRNYPIIIGKNLRKGIMIFPNRRMGGMDLLIVWLNRDVKSGIAFDTDAIEKVNAVFHFVDKESMQRTIDVLTDAVKGWKDG